MLAIGILSLGVLARLIVHVPNFTPVVALALFSGAYLKGKQAIIIPLTLFAISDIFLGAHPTMFFTWGSVLLIVGIGQWLKKHKNFKMILSSSIISALVFFIVTNLGVWLVAGLYPLTFEGLVECFVMAVPFFRTTLASTLIYAFVLFGLYEVCASRLKQTRLATVLK